METETETNGDDHSDNDDDDDDDDDDVDNDDNDAKRNQWSLTEQRTMCIVYQTKSHAHPSP